MPGFLSPLCVDQAPQLCGHEQMVAGEAEPAGGLN